MGRNYKQIDKGRREKKKLVSGIDFTQLKTTHQRYADVFEKLGYKIDLSIPIFDPKANLSPSLQKLIDYSSTKKLIGIAPFAAHKGKMYPLEQMKMIIEDISKSYKVLLFGGGKKEIDVLDGIEKRYNNTISIAGKVSLDEELDLISNLDLMVSMDSANAHIAAMLGKRVITIWGVTHPYAGFYPFNQPIEYGVLPDRKKYPMIPTSIYGNKYPKNYENAASSISPKIIITKISSVLEKTI